MTERARTLTSVGVDVGTTTTHAIVSELRVETPPGDAGTPEIADRTIVHRGEIRETPLLDAETIDVDRVAALVERELAAADLTPADVDTGAVIVTGETARRANAEPLVHRLADDAGRFVAAVAGASLEAVLAGRGSGAADLAADRNGLVANVDVGGGTTNVAIFDGREIDAERAGHRGVAVAETRCLDVGGRLVTVDGGRITSVSPPARAVADAFDLPLAVGDDVDEEALESLAAAMADLVVDCCTGPPYDDLTASLAIGALPTESPSLEAVVFSGGVGRLVASPSDDPFAYGDLGGLLAAAIRDHETVRSWPVATPAEDVRATVVGAGTESTTLSGRTVSIEPSLLPLRNVPVAAVGDVSGADAATLERRFGAAVAGLVDRYDPGEVPAFGLSIRDVGDLTYDRVRAVATALTSALETLPPSLPVVIVARQNCAKVLGQTLRRTTDRPLVVLDELAVGDGDYLDVGEPMSGGESVPVVMKTLAFGE